MKQIKKFTYYIVFFSLVLGACGRQDKEDAERLVAINKQVESLYNEEMNDLVEEISIERFDEIKSKIEFEKDEEFNEANEETLADIEALYDNAWAMFELEEDIDALFDDEIVAEGVDFDAVEPLSTRLSEIDSDQWISYVARQEGKLEEAEEQIAQEEEAVELSAQEEEAIMAVDNLFDEEGQVRSDIGRDHEGVAREVVYHLPDTKLRTALKNRLIEVDEILSKRYAEKTKKSIGDYTGYYHLEESNELITITEDRFEGFIPFSGSFFNYEIVEVVRNSGDQITLILYHEEYTDEETGGHPIPETTTEVTWKLVEGGKYIEANGSRMRRITATEFEEIKSNP